MLVRKKEDCTKTGWEKISLEEVQVKKHLVRFVLFQVKGDAT